MKGAVSAVALALVVWGCTAIPYQPHSGRPGHGYSETQLDSNVFKVAFKGNHFNEVSEATDYTLLRSAELTLAHGFKYFVVINQESETNFDFWAGAQPRASNTIHCYKEKPDSFAYNAERVRDEIKRKYGI